MVLLQASGISKSFGGVRALHDVTFELRAGEVHALIGENGAGKSTLIKILTGAYRADGGELRLNGTLLHHHSPAEAQARGIRCVYQQPVLFPSLSVAENIALALEPHTRLARVDWSGRRRRAQELLARVGATIQPEREVSTLTMPEQYLVEIARALGADAKVLILDEPTACLSSRETDVLFRLILELKSSSKGIIYVSHRLEELSRIADRVTVLRDGETVTSCNMADTSVPELIQRMVGRTLSAIYPKVPAEVGEPVIELSGVGCASTGVRRVSLTVRAGEIVGLAGMVGSGRTELANIIFGLTPPDSGEIRLGGKPVTIRSPLEAHTLGIGYVHENRRHVGIIGAMPVSQNMTLAVLDQVSQSGFLEPAREFEIAGRYRKELGVKTDSLDTLVENLSGGNQQKVALGKWLATNPRLMILDEPTQGVDVGAKAEVHRLISQLAAQGMAILMISSEMAEIVGMSDRVVVMSGGTIAGELTREQATQERILELALRGSVQ